MKILYTLQIRKAVYSVILDLFKNSDDQTKSQLMGFHMKHFVSRDLFWRISAGPREIAQNPNFYHKYKFVKGST